jgi:hypothetical protein
MIRETIERYRIPGTHRINWAIGENSGHTFRGRLIQSAENYVVIEAPIFAILTAIRNTYRARGEVTVFDAHSPDRIQQTIAAFQEGAYIGLPYIYMFENNLHSQYGIHRQIAAAALGDTDCPYLILRSDLKDFNNLLIPYTVLWDTL